VLRLIYCTSKRANAYSKPTIKTFFKNIIMKKFLIIALILVTGISTTFANSRETVNEKISKAFTKDFAGAQDVKWENKENFAKATFTLNSQVMFAFYSQDGDLLGVTRNIVSSQLPINLLSDLKKGYSNYWITDLFEMGNNSNTAYYVTLENSTHTIVLKSTGTEGWTVFSRTRKAD
jgi:hypothetical protein